MARACWRRNAGAGPHQEACLLLRPLQLTGAERPGGPESKDKTALGMQGIALGASLGPLPSPMVRISSGRAATSFPPTAVAAPRRRGARHLQLILHPTPSSNGSGATCQLPAALQRVSVDPPAEPWQICRMHQEAGSELPGCFSTT